MPTALPLLAQAARERAAETARADRAEQHSKQMHGELAALQAKVTIAVMRS